MIRFVLIFLITLNCFAQNNSQFIIKEFVNDRSVHYLNKNNFPFKNDVIFEDSTYKLTASCKGEWGGTLFFANKVSNKVYYVSSTCPVAINKLNNKYYVSNTLMHGSGHSNVLEINNPDSLMIHLNENGKKKTKLMGEIGIKSNKGSTTLLESKYGEFIITSFTFQNKLYHIVSDYKTTFLTEVKNNKFERLATISQKSIRNYEPKLYKTKDNHTIVFFENDETEGYLDIFENKINVMRIK